MKTVRFELLLGRVVRDPDGKKAGRILEVRVEPEGEDRVVTEYLLGAAALKARLGLSAGREPLRIPWDLLDLRDPGKPRLRCALAELERKKG